MNKLHKEYRITKGLEPQTSQFVEQLKGFDPFVYMRISPSAKISLSCGEGIDFESCWLRYNAFYSPTYSSVRKRLIAQLLASYKNAAGIHESYKNAPKHISLQTITIQSKYNEAVAARDASVKELTKQKENVPLKKYKIKPTSPSFLTSRKMVEEDLRNEAIARFSKFGISAPSEQAIQSFISERMEQALAMERKHAEELNDYNLKVEQSLAIAANAAYQKEHDKQVQEIADKIDTLNNKTLSVDQFYEDERKSFENYLDTLFYNLKFPYPIDLVVDYDQGNSTAKVNITFPDASQCNLPIRVAKMAGKEIQVYEYPSTAINIEYAKSISSMAYLIAVSLLDGNPYLSTVILSGTDDNDQNGLFVALFTRPDFESLNMSDVSIERLMSRFIVVADYPGESYAFNPIPITCFKSRLQFLINEASTRGTIANSMAVSVVQAQAIAEQVRSATDVELAVAEALKNHANSVRIDGKYSSILKELGYDARNEGSRSTHSIPDTELSLIGNSDISSEIAESTAVDHFLEWRDKKKNVLELRGVSEVDGNKIRLTQRFVTTRYSSRLLDKFNINPWSDDYVFLSRTRFAQIEASHLPEEYTNYLREFGTVRMEKAKEYELDGKIPRAIKEYERCLEYGCTLEAPFDNLIRLYNRMGDVSNVARVEELKHKTWE